MNANMPPQLPPTYQPDEPEESRNYPIQPPAFDLPPVGADFTPIPPAPTEEKVAFAGLKRAILSRIDTFVAGRHEEAHIHDHVIRSGPSGATRVRGFYSLPEHEDVRPLSFIEKRAANRNQRIKDRLHNRERDRMDLHAVYGGVPEDMIDTSKPIDPPKPEPAIKFNYPEGQEPEEPPVIEVPLFETTPTQTEKVKDMDKKSKDLATAPKSRLYETRIDVLPDGRKVKSNTRDTREMERSVKRDKKKDDLLRRQIHSAEERLENLEHGRTLYGRFRRAKIRMLDRARDYTGDLLHEEDMKLLEKAREPSRIRMQALLDAWPPRDTLTPEQAEVFDMQVRIIERERADDVRKAQIKIAPEHAADIDRRLRAQFRDWDFAMSQRSRRMRRTAEGRRRLKEEFNKDGVRGTVPEEDAHRKP